MKKLINSSLTWLSIILLIAFLSSCENMAGAEKSTSDYFSTAGHQYLQFGFGDPQGIVHDPKCERKDLITLIDSLNRAK
jgi:hypothetical protein